MSVEPFSEYASYFNAFAVPVASKDSGADRMAAVGHRIVFCSWAREDGPGPHIYSIRLDGTERRLITDGRFPCWSRDGQRIYFRSWEAGSPQVWKISKEGGRAVQVTQNDGMMPKELENEGYLYYAKRTPGKKGGEVWRVSLQGGEEEKIYEPIFYRHWDIIGDRLYFVEYGRWDIIEDQRYFVEYENWWICMMDVNTKEVTQLHQMPDETGIMDLAVAPDEKWVYCAFYREGSHDLMLAENFR
jgi:Tol biopolymer transport system component